MDFREISYIAAIAKHQNITKAAEALYISQPALSKFLMSLEDELGLKLFDRVERKYIPTYTGKDTSNMPGLSLRPKRALTLNFPTSSSVILAS